MPPPPRVTEALGAPQYPAPAPPPLRSTRGSSFTTTTLSTSSAASPPTANGLRTNVSVDKPDSDDQPDYIYEEKYLAPQFRKFLAERKEDEGPH